jgi:hypothetical protein
MTLAPSSSRGHWKTGSVWIVRQSGSNLAIRLLLLVVTAVGLFLTGPRAATAAGCHVSERPAIARALTWDRLTAMSLLGDRHLPTSVLPAFVPPSCPGETPTLASSTTQILASPFQAEPSSRPLARGETILVPCVNPQPPPFPSQLLRPPRRAAFRLIRESSSPS